MEQEILKGLAKGNQVLKLIQGEMSLENVEKLMADTAEALDYQRVMK
jgi:charged multivesicular body protein 6